jgi:hypothetical protein
LSPRPNRTHAAAAPATATGPAPVEVRVGELDVGRRELLVLAGVLVVQWMVNWHFASRSWFIFDDFETLYRAHTSGWGLDYLLRPVNDHVTPGVRTVAQLLVPRAAFDWNVALGFVLACHSISVVLLQRILRLVFGPRWWTLAIAFVYGISIVILPSLEWFSAGVLALPATTFSLAAIHGYLCWWRTGRRRWLAWSVIAVGGGLFFYVKVLLVPIYLLLIRVLLLEPGTRVRAAARAAAREWRVWALYVLPMVVAIVTYLAKGSYESRSVPLDWIPGYLTKAWSIGFVPALMGIRVPQSGERALHTAAVVGCQLAVFAGVVFSVARERSAWRAWAVVFVAFVLNAFLVIPRVALYGAEAVVYSPALGVRYFNESVYVALIVIPFAFARPRGAWAPSLPRPGQAWPRFAASAVTVALVAYTAFAWASDAAFDRHWSGSKARSWSDNVRGDLDRLERAHPVLLDAPLPKTIAHPLVASKEIPPPNYLSAILPLFNSGLRFDQVSDQTYRVRPGGHLQAVRFEPAAGGNVRDLRETGFLTITGPAAYAPAGLCLGITAQPSSLEVRPQRALRGRAWYLRTTYATASTVGISLVIDRGVGYPPVSDRALPWRPLPGTELTELGALPTGVPTLARVRADIPAGQRTCFSRFVFGSYVPD